MNPLAAALAALPADTGRLVIGYSGGRDSSVLLDLAAGQFAPERLVVCHVCHHLEPAARAWAEQCRRRCLALGLAFWLLDVTVDSRDGGLEAAARSARYAAIAERLCPDDVFVSAHHQDDQAETVLLQALRGAGMSGLAGMPAIRTLGAGRHWRPWLSMSRTRISQHAVDSGLDWVTDPTNTDPARDRGYLAATIWPALIERWPAAGETLSRVAGHAAAAREAIAELAAIDLEATMAGDGTLAVAGLAGLSDNRQREAIRAWCRARRASMPDHRHCREIQRLLHVREHNSPRVAFADHEVRRFDGRLFLMPRLGPPPSPRQRMAWNAGQPIDLPADAGRLSLADTNQRPGGDLSIGFREGGERLVSRYSLDQSLKRFCQSRRIPPWIRERMPLIFEDDRLIAVADFWFCDTPAGGDETLSVSASPFVWSHRLAGADPAL